MLVISYSDVSYVPLTLNGTDRPTVSEPPKSFKEEVHDLFIEAVSGPAEDKS